MSYSKYHAPDSVPFPGNDAVTLALGFPEEPPSSGNVRFVTSGHGKLCIDCMYCLDNDRPARPDLWLCFRSRMTAEATRSGYFSDSDCGHDAIWYDRAICEDE